MPFPMTYYLAIEGKSPWKDLEAAVFLGHEKIKTFGLQNNIPLQEKASLFTLLWARKLCNGEQLLQ